MKVFPYFWINSSLKSDIAVVDTPREHCYLCQEPFAPGDRGIILDYFEPAACVDLHKLGRDDVEVAGTVTPMPLHRHCFLGWLGIDPKN